MKQAHGVNASEGPFMAPLGHGIWNFKGDRERSLAFQLCFQFCKGSGEFVSRKPKRGRWRVNFLYLGRVVVKAASQVGLAEAGVLEVMGLTMQRRGPMDKGRKT